MAAWRLTEVMDAIAVGMHTVKKVTMRVCWAEYLGPLKERGARPHCPHGARRAAEHTRLLILL